MKKLSYFVIVLILSIKFVYSVGNDDNIDNLHQKGATYQRCIDYSRDDPDNLNNFYYVMCECSDATTFDDYAAVLFQYASHSSIAEIKQQSFSVLWTNYAQANCDNLVQLGFRLISESVDEDFNHIIAGYLLNVLEYYTVEELNELLDLSKNAESDFFKLDLASCIIRHITSIDYERKDNLYSRRRIVVLQNAVKILLDVACNAKDLANKVGALIRLDQHSSFIKQVKIRCELIQIVHEIALSLKEDETLNSYHIQELNRIINLAKDTWFASYATQILKDANHL